MDWFDGSLNAKLRPEACCSGYGTEAPQSKFWVPAAVTYALPIEDGRAWSSSYRNSYKAIAPPKTEQPKRLAKPPVENDAKEESKAVIAASDGPTPAQMRALAAKRRRLAKRIDAELKQALAEKALDAKRKQMMDAFLVRAKRLAKAKKAEKNTPEQKSTRESWKPFARAHIKPAKAAPRAVTVAAAETRALQSATEGRAARAGNLDAPWTKPWWQQKKTSAWRKNARLRWPKKSEYNSHYVRPSTAARKWLRYPVTKPIPTDDASFRAPGCFTRG